MRETVGEDDEERELHSQLTARYQERKMEDISKPRNAVVTLLEEVGKPEKSKKSERKGISKSK